MKIDKLINKKNNKIKVLMDDQTELELFENVIVDLNLFSKSFSLDVILKANEKEKVKYKILKYIERKMRSKKDVLKELDKLTEDKKIKEEILKYLEEVKLIDDKRFALAYVNDKFIINKWGREKIKKGLRQNGIFDYSFLEIIDRKKEKERLNSLIEKYLKKKNNGSFLKLKQKLKTYLINKGYEIKDINDAIKDIVYDDSFALIKDYDKLKKKYKVNELNQQLIQKLLAKGYKYESIKKLEK